MKKIFFVLTGSLLIGCSGESADNSEEKPTTDSTKVEIESDLEELTEEQLNSSVVAQFLSLTKQVVEDEDYCFNYEEVEGLCKGNKAILDGWDIPIVVTEGNFLSVFNQLCSSMIDFKLINFNNEGYAFLTKTSKNSHDFELYNYDKEQSIWTDKSELLPEIKCADFFEELTKEEEKLVKEYGVFFLYLDEAGIYFSFSDWRMSENLLDDKGVEFFHEADHELKLKWSDGKFWVEKLTWD